LWNVDEYSYAVELKLVHVQFDKHWEKQHTTDIKFLNNEIGILDFY